MRVIERTKRAVSRKFRDRLGMGLSSLLGPPAPRRLAQPILVSLTTIDSRLRFIAEVVESLHRQTLPPDEVHLFVSEEPYLLDKGIRRNELPEELLRLQGEGRVNIHFTENTGPFRKLLPLLERRIQDDCLIVTADDDSLVPFDWLERLYRSHLENPGQVVSFRNRIMTRGPGGLLPYMKWPVHPVAGPTPDPLDLFPTGRDGVLYSTRFFDASVFDRAYLELCPRGDDIWFKFHTLANGVGVRGVGPSRIPFGIEFHELDCRQIRLFDQNKDVGAPLNNDIQIAKVIEYMRGQGKRTSAAREAV